MADSRCRPPRSRVHEDARPILAVSPPALWRLIDVRTLPSARRRLICNLMPTIQAMRNAGALTLSEVASALNARGVRPARGGKWHRSSVRNLIARIKECLDLL